MSQHSALNAVGNVASFGAIIGSITHLLPSFAAIVAVVWYLLEIYESKAVQDWLKHRRARHRHRRYKRHLSQKRTLPEP